MIRQLATDATYVCVVAIVIAGTAALASPLLRSGTYHWRQYRQWHPDRATRLADLSRPAKGDPGPCPPPQRVVTITNPCGCAYQFIRTGKTPCPPHAAAQERMAWESRMDREMRQP